MGTRLPSFRRLLISSSVGLYITPSHTCHTKAKSLACRGEGSVLRGATPLGCRTLVLNNHLFLGTAPELPGYTLSSDNGALSGEAYAEATTPTDSARSSRVHSDLCA